jgi:hypothetical protein
VRLFIIFLVNFGFMLKLVVLHVLRFSSYWGRGLWGVASRVESGGLIILSKFNAYKYFSHKCAISGYNNRKRNSPFNVTQRINKGCKFNIVLGGKS